MANATAFDGVPAEIAEGKWRDPDHRLTPGAKYLLHNHSNVARVLSHAEYRLYMNYGSCYFSAGFMLFAACFCLYPLDRDGQLQQRRNVIRTIELPAPAATARCPNCSGEIPADAWALAPVVSPLRRGFPSRIASITPFLGQNDRA